MDVEKIIQGLSGENETLKALIYLEMTDLSEIGLNMLNSKRLEHIENKIYALRIYSQSKFIRIYLTPMNNQFICFYIFEKKSNKIPNKELDTIRNRYKRIRQKYGN